jgi:hypothetical protein
MTLNRHARSTITAAQNEHWILFRRGQFPDLIDKPTKARIDVVRHAALVFEL